MDREALARRYYNIALLRRRAKQILPKVIFDFADGAAEDEITLRRNEDDFDRLEIVPRMMRGVATPDLSIEIFGQKLAMPVMIAPTGLSGVLWPHGEICAAKAAVAAGTIYCQSHGSTCSIEELAASVTHNRWFQVFLYRERSLTQSMVERAQATGAGALILTVDNQVLGQRERDLANGFTIPPRITAANMLDMATKIPWLWRYFQGPEITFANYKGAASHSPDIASLGAYIAKILDPGLSWKDVAWVRSIWKGPFLLKGVLHPEDARIAHDHGVDGLLVSNHGGRQLDTAISSIGALPAVAEAVGDRMTILLDGGVRRGVDVLRAMALGARACLIGRPHWWGMATAGEDGVALVLDILQRELARAMSLAGIASTAEIGPHLLSRTALTAAGPKPQDKPTVRLAS